MRLIHYKKYLVESNNLEPLRKIINDIKETPNLNLNTPHENLIGDFYSVLQKQAEKDSILWKKRNDLFTISASIGFIGTACYKAEALKEVTLTNAHKLIDKFK